MRLLPLLLLAGCEIAPVREPLCYRVEGVTVTSERVDQCPAREGVASALWLASSRAGTDPRIFAGVDLVYLDRSKLTCPGCGRGCPDLVNGQVYVAARHGDHLAIATHELVHVAAWRLTGDADPEHARGMWEGL